jgi:hypothetical protein
VSQLFALLVSALALFQHIAAPADAHGGIIVTAPTDEAHGGIISVKKP